MQQQRNNSQHHHRHQQHDRPCSSSWRRLRNDWRLAFWLCVLLVGFFQLTLIAVYDSAVDTDRRNGAAGELIYLLDVPPRPRRPVRRELKLIRIDADGVDGDRGGGGTGTTSSSTRTRTTSSFTDTDNVLKTHEPAREPVIPVPAKAMKEKVPKLKKKQKEKENNANKKQKVPTGEMPTEMSGAASDASAHVEMQLQAIQKAGKLYSIGRKDRSGSVIVDQMFAHAYAYAHGVEYAGACFTVHGLPKRDTRTLLAQLGWDAYLKFGCPSGESIVNDPDAEQSPLVLHDDVYRNNIDQSYFTPAWRAEIQRVLQHSSSNANGGGVTKTTKEELNQNKPFEIAVHVRRGDVTPCRYKRRYLPNSHYLALIDQYRPKDHDDNKNNSRPTHVTIYSESDSFEPFDDFRHRGYTVQLDTDLADVWRALASADVTILSRSFFSFVPAAVNPHTVVFTTFFGFEPLSFWHRADEALVAQSDRQIRQMYETQCNATAVELERQLNEQKHHVSVPGRRMESI
jgi:hypothetical protein